MPGTTRIEAIRRFNRFYTRRIGVLHEGLLDSAFTLTESRLLWELAHADGLTATQLARTLELDAGYLSRLLTGLKERGLIQGTRSADDARQQHLALTPAGRRAFAPLDARSRADVSALLASLDAPQQQELLASMSTIERLLGAAPAARAEPYTLRPHRAGDIGWVVSRHGALYAAEYGWDMRFEALVARIAADFIDRFNARREACWIAERGGERIGSIFLMQARDEATQAPLDGIAQLRLLLIEPSARGLGLGKRLVDACTRFARQAGYRKIMLWTNANLLAARGIYAKAGYALTHTEQHRSFGHALVGEIWELEL
ncbi:MAG TPA: helix-turn-helix domain-containing GNAT family N-acetyltransferase [Burkholderiaceae bacterium]|nr:helix-turn-helix domain-containing GNAT family N-acetyltransferase [Burkholderiaceae bacterium]